jgi:hypothetical protein
LSKLQYLLAMGFRYLFFIAAGIRCMSQIAKKVHSVELPVVYSSWSLWVMIAAGIISVFMVKPIFVPKKTSPASSLKSQLLPSFSTAVSVCGVLIIIGFVSLAQEISTAAFVAEMILLTIFFLHALNLDYYSTIHQLTSHKAQNQIDTN